MDRAPMPYFDLPARTGVRVAPEAPPAAAVEDGRIRLGLFTAPLRSMNLRAAHLFDIARRRRPVPPLVVEWIGAGMAHPEWYLGMIIVDAKIFSLGVVYGFHRTTGDYFSHDCVALPGRARVAETTWNSTTSIASRGFRSEVRHRLEEGRHEFTVDIRAAGKRPAVAGSLVWHEPLGKTQPLVMLSPVGESGFIYNHRAQMPVEGSLRIGKHTVDFDPQRDLANLDEVKVHALERQLSYRWFNFSGFDSRGRIVGLDLAHTPQKPDPYWAENCLWVGDKLYTCAPVHFENDPRDLMKPWHARDDEGRIDITFTPEGGKTVNLGPVGKYHQKCGRFNGKVVDDAGETHVIRDYFGCAESADILSRR